MTLLVDECMSRVRIGYAHVANNRYDGWKMYAIGGSSDPTILSEGNYYHALDNPDVKEVRASLSLYVSVHSSSP